MDNLLLQLDAKDTASPVLKRFANNTRDAGKGINSLGKNLKDAAGEIPGLGNAMNVMGKGPLVALAAGAVAVATGFAVMVKSSIDMADNMNDMSLKLGISTEKLSVLKLYADQSGTSLEDVADSMAKLGVKLASGDKELEKLGITASTTDEAFYQVADRIAATEDPMIRLKIANDAFGKSGKEMLPMLVQGGDALRKMSQEAPIVSTEFAAMSDEFNDKLAVIKGGFVSLGLSITENVLPALSTMLDITNEILKKVPLKNERDPTKYIDEQIADLEKKINSPVTGLISLNWKLSEGALRGQLEAYRQMRAEIMPESGILGGSQNGYRGESLVKPKSAQQQAAEDAAAKKLTDSMKPTEIDLTEFTLAAEAERLDKESKLRDVIERLATEKLGTEVDVSELSKQQISDEVGKNFDAQKATEKVLDKPREEQLKKEEEKNKKLIEMANTTAAALSTPFQQFGQDLLAGNKSLASSFEDLFGNIAASFANMLIQMAADMLAKAAIFTLFNALTGGGFGAASGGIGAFTGLSSLIPGFATGTNYAPGGLALVGEQGPELVQLPRGSKVRTARETAQSGITQVVNIYNQNLSEKQITDIVVKSQRKIALESKWRRTNV